MVDYAILSKGVNKTIDEVKIYSIGKIEMILNEEIPNLNQDLQKSLNRLIIDICEDRCICDKLGVDYINLPKEDIKKIKVLALYLVKEDPDIILPLF